MYIRESIDVTVEKARLAKKIEKMTKQLSGVSAQLSNEKFLEKASKEYVEQVREQAQELTKTLEKAQHFYNAL